MNREGLDELIKETEYRLKFSSMRLKFFLVIYVLVNTFTDKYVELTTLLLVIFLIIFLLMKFISIRLKRKSN